MSKKISKIALKYLEGFIYCFVLIVSVLLCTSGNTFIKMIPIAFLSGAVGQIMFGKKAMTSIFSCIISIVLLQVRTPGTLVQNITSTVVITVLSLVGELCGYSLKKLIHLIKLKSTKRREKEKLKNYIICCTTIIIGVIINSLVNGNLISYIRCKDNLKQYLYAEYSSTSRFKIFSARYSLEDKAKYTFFTRDVLNNNEVGKFVVYLDDRKTVQDDYKQKVIDTKIREMTSYIQNIEKSEGINIQLGMNETDNLTLDITKTVNEVNEESINLFAQEIVNIIDKVSDVKGFEEVEQMRIVLECNENEKENLASYIYMNGYNEMQQKNEENPVDYIKKALNIEYIY